MSLLMSYRIPFHACNRILCRFEIGLSVSLSILDRYCEGRGALLLSLQMMMKPLSISFVILQKLSPSVAITISCYSLFVIKSICSAISKVSMSPEILYTQIIIIENSVYHDVNSLVAFTVVMWYSIMYFLLVFIHLIAFRIESS